MVSHANGKLFTIRDTHLSVNPDGKGSPGEEACLIPLRRQCNRYSHGTFGQLPAWHSIESGTPVPGKGCIDVNISL